MKIDLLFANPPPPTTSMTPPPGRFLVMMGHKGKMFLQSQMITAAHNQCCVFISPGLYTLPPCLILNFAIQSDCFIRCKIIS